MIESYRHSIDDLPEVAHDLYISSCGFSHFDDRDYCFMREQGRADYHLIYMVQNCGSIYICDAWHTLQQGDVAIIYPGEAHGYNMQMQDNAQYYWMHFFGENVVPYLSALHFMHEHIFHVGISDFIEKTFKRIMNELMIKRPNYTLLCGGYLRNLLSYISRKGVYPAHFDATDFPEAIQKAVQMINSDFKKSVSIEAYAAMSNYSTSYFIRLFKTATGYTPVDYRNMVRIENACLIMEHSSYTLTQIAHMTGFEEPSYFTKVFKKFIGKTPCDYRNAKKQ